MKNLECVDFKNDLLLRIFLAYYLMMCIFKFNDSFVNATGLNHVKERTECVYQV